MLNSTAFSVGTPTQEGTRYTREQEALIFSCEKSIRRRAWNLTQKFKQGDWHFFEELVSIGMVTVCEVVTRLPDDCESPLGYLLRATQYEMLETCIHDVEHATVSLDAPLWTFEDSGDGVCLSDLLPDRPRVSSELSDKRAQAVHEALSRLPVNDLDLLLSRYEFEGRTYTSSLDMAKQRGVSLDAFYGMRKAACAKLRVDPLLCEAVGTPVPVKPIEEVPPPEVLYAEALVAWNAGHQTEQKLAQALGMSRSAARARILKMREVDLIAAREVVERRPAEELYAEALAAWNAGHQSERKLARALGVSSDVARNRIIKMRKLGLLPALEVPEPLPSLDAALAAWNAGHQSEGKLARALGLSKQRASTLVKKMRAAGIISTKPRSNRQYWQQYQTESK